MEAIWKIAGGFPAFYLVDDKGKDFFRQIHFAVRPLREAVPSRPSGRRWSMTNLISLG